MIACCVAFTDRFACETCDDDNSTDKIAAIAHCNCCCGNQSLSVVYSDIVFHVCGLLVSQVCAVRLVALIACISYNSRFDYGTCMSCVW